MYPNSSQQMFTSRNDHSKDVLRQKIDQIQERCFDFVTVSLLLLNHESLLFARSRLPLIVSTDDSSSILFFYVRWKVDDKGQFGTQATRRKR